VTGDGSNKPKGFLAYPLVTGTPTFGQIKQMNSGSAGALVADKLFDVIHALKAGYRPGSIWQMQSLTVALVRKLKDSTGRYLWEPSLQVGVPSTLAGYAVIENEDMPAAGAGANAIAFGNFKRGYTIADVQGTRVVRDPYTNKGNVLFYTTKRLGGAVVDSNALIVHQLS
jgi:HK97 family phage major capsid protein